MVVGRLGSGCSTFLKTICGELSGLALHEDSLIHFNGMSLRASSILIGTDISARHPPEKDGQRFKGEVIYNQEVDKHFPHLAVGEILGFVAGA